MNDNNNDSKNVLDINSRVIVKTQLDPIHGGPQLLAKLTGTIVGHGGMMGDWCVQLDDIEPSDLADKMLRNAVDGYDQHESESARRYCLKTMCSESAAETIVDELQLTVELMTESLRPLSTDHYRTMTIEQLADFRQTIADCIVTNSSELQSIDSLTVVLNRIDESFAARCECEHDWSVELPEFDMDGTRFIDEREPCDACEAQSRSEDARLACALGAL